MSDLKKLFTKLRRSAKSAREKGTYFEELCLAYLRNEPSYKDLYQQVWSYADWAKQQGVTAQDTGIDLVAETHTNDIHAIQCKFYAADYRIQKKDIDSFFNASGKKPFSNRIIITTTYEWSKNAEAALSNQQIPVTKIDLLALEASKIDWSKYQPQKPIIFKGENQLYPHQQQAVTNVTAGLQTRDRGKMIMACGTGKTFTSLKIAEKLAGKGETVLFLVPSLALLSQTLTEWTQQSATPLHSFAVCSDITIGKKKNNNDDKINLLAHELRYPATTNAKSLAEQLNKRHDAKHMTVVFATYHSIEVISKAQKNNNLPDFKLIICDEAHRTTGATFAGEDDSNFTKVHSNSNIKANKRLYMTATPRVYGDKAKGSANDTNTELCSMDDVELYGDYLHVLSFSESVAKNLLVDYKVIVLAIDEHHIASSLQNMWKDDDNSLKLSDAAKIVGCWKALSKQYFQDNSATDSKPMQRAVAFCQVIEPMDGKTNKTHKVSSKEIAQMFQEVIDVYQQQQPISYQLECQVKHVDGSMNATEKEQKISWLKAEAPEDTCKILSNVRCLTEGVDVPALDAILFLSPRKSEIDVVQAVGRVMRKAKNKNKGYIILPVVVPAQVSPEQALNDNDPYRVVWEVLQALRSHDDRFDAMVNRMRLDGADKNKMEVIAITDKLQRPSSSSTSESAQTTNKIGRRPKEPDSQQTTMVFTPGAIEQALYAKVVEKCGNRRHWEEWAKDIATIANTHITRITAIIEDNNNTEAQQEFIKFANALRHNINSSISNTEVIEMLAQHLITKPVFNALFAGYDFAEHNPISQDMQKVLDVLEQYGVNKEAETLTEFYNSVKLRVEGTQTDGAKQKILVELYDKFFRNAFPNMTERLGIVYTPIEVVDFIIHSVNDLLKQEFNQTLASEDVHILDPFTGTGTFITRLLQSGLISKDKLANKYNNQIHANEIVLLAYYIAAINIEATYHALVGKTSKDYKAFNGICLTDTFAMNEAKDMLPNKLIANNARLKKQEQLPITVIISNPPYSAGQKNENDNNQNLDYPKLDTRIQKTYVDSSTSTRKSTLYDSYIRAIRWASDRLGDKGIIGFVTNAGFIESSSADGMRQCLVEEFSNIYIFHLRGNQRTSGEKSRQEGGKIFGAGSRAPIAITLLVKNPQATEHGKIYFYDIGDYLSQQQKLDKIKQLHSIAGINQQQAWQQITPDKHGDWLQQRDNTFDNFIKLGDKKAKHDVTIFTNYSLGVATNRDPWVYNASYQLLCSNMKKTINFYNAEVSRYESQQKSIKDIKQFLNKDPSLISWTDLLHKSVEKLVNYEFNKDNIRQAVYRPFTKQWQYFDKNFNQRRYQIPKIFPTAETENRVICVSGIGSSKDFSALISNTTIDLEIVSKSQCFPLYLYEENTSSQNDLFASANNQKYQRQDAISDAGLQHFQTAYPNQAITKEDIFYYIYGILHCPEYKKRYANNLKKQLPRIPCVKTFSNFTKFSQAGRELAELHINYESVDKYPVTIDSKINNLEDRHYYVTKMKFAKKTDKSKIIYNPYITISNIPLDAYEYVVNGKPAIEWVMERQGVSVHKDSGIKNDANNWAIDTMHNAQYPLELLQRVITVSLKTNEIVNNLPEFDID